MAEPAEQRTYDDAALDAHVLRVEEPDFDARPLLQKGEDDVDGLQEDALLT